MVPVVPQEFRSLLDYFVQGMTISISCHKGIQDEICSSILPMAMEVPHLLSAVLALAAAHRQPSGPAQEKCPFELMKGKSIKQLRSALDLFDPTESDQVLATTLILCMAEIISPDSGAASWRSHLHGAASLAACAPSSTSSTSKFLRRKFQALQAVALACGSKSYEGEILLGQFEEAHARIDDLAGYSTSLLPIFKAINDLERSQEGQDVGFICHAPPGLPHFGCNSSVEHQSHLLFDRIQGLMAKRNLSPIQSTQGLSWAVRQELHLLDEAYHHMAILQVFRRGSLSVPRQMIEDSRRAILTCLAAMSFQRTPCPGVAALSPLFVAGSLCMDAADRDRVRGLLKTMWVNYGMANVISCRNVLEKWWKEQDDSRDRSTPFSFQSAGKGNTSVPSTQYH
jgi:hypothetical protein